MFLLTRCGLIDPFHSFIYVTQHRRVIRRISGKPVHSVCNGAPRHVYDNGINETEGSRGIGATCIPVKVFVANLSHDEVVMWSCFTHTLSPFV